MPQAQTQSKHHRLVGRDDPFLRDQNPRQQTNSQTIPPQTPPNYLLITNLNDKVCPAFLRTKFSQVGQVGDVKIPKLCAHNAGIASVRIFSQTDPKLFVSKFDGFSFFGGAICVETDNGAKAFEAACHKLQNPIVSTSHDSTPPTKDTNVESYSPNWSPASQSDHRRSPFLSRPSANQTASVRAHSARRHPPSTKRPRSNAIPDTRPNQVKTYASNLSDSHLRDRAPRLPFSNDLSRTEQSPADRYRSLSARPQYDEPSYPRREGSSNLYRPNDSPACHNFLDNNHASYRNDIQGPPHGYRGRGSSDYSPVPASHVRNPRYPFGQFHRKRPHYQSRFSDAYHTKNSYNSPRRHFDSRSVQNSNDDYTRFIRNKDRKRSTDQISEHLGLRHFIVLRSVPNCVSSDEVLKHFKNYRPDHVRAVSKSGVLEMHFSRCEDRDKALDRGDFVMGGQYLNPQSSDAATDAHEHSRSPAAHTSAGFQYPTSSRERLSRNQSNLHRPENQRERSEFGFKRRRNSYNSSPHDGRTGESGSPKPTETARTSRDHFLSQKPEKRTKGSHISDRYSYRKKVDSPFSHSDARRRMDRPEILNNTHAQSRDGKTIDGAEDSTHINYPPSSNQALRTSGHIRKKSSALSGHKEIECYAREVKKDDIRESFGEIREENCREPETMGEIPPKHGEELPMTKDELFDKVFDLAIESVTKHYAELESKRCQGLAAKAVFDFLSVRKKEDASRQKEVTIKKRQNNFEAPNRMPVGADAFTDTPKYIPKARSAMRPGSKREQKDAIQRREVEEVRKRPRKRRFADAQLNAKKNDEKSSIRHADREVLTSAATSKKIDIVPLTSATNEGMSDNENEKRSRILPLTDVEMETSLSPKLNMSVDQLNHGEGDDHGKHSSDSFMIEPICSPQSLPHPRTQPSSNEALLERLPGINKANGESCIELSKSPISDQEPTILPPKAKSTSLSVLRSDTDLPSLVLNSSTRALRRVDDTENEKLRKPKKRQSLKMSKTSASTHKRSRKIMKAKSKSRKAVKTIPVDAIDKKSSTITSSRSVTSLEDDNECAIMSKQTEPQVALSTKREATDKDAASKSVDCSAETDKADQGTREDSGTDIGDHEHEGECARGRLYLREHNNNKRRQRLHLQGVSGKSALSSRQCRQETRVYRKGVRQIKPKNDLINLNSLQQRWKKVQFDVSSIHGMGLFAKESIDSDQFVIEYIGDIVRRTVADLREKEYTRKGMGDSYLFRLNAEMVVDATRQGGIARFINHSCDPNVSARIISVEGRSKIAFYSKRPISVGEELTYDYKFEYEADDKKIACLCGAVNCRKALN